MSEAITTPEIEIEIAPDLLSTEAGGELVLMSVTAGKYFSFDEVGTDVWRRLQKETRVDSVCASLASDYQAEPGMIERDVCALLAELGGHGLIQVKSACADA